MPDISLDLRRVDYRSDQNASATAWRAYIDILFKSKTGAFPSCDCIVDSGAAFSVVPYSFWQTYQVNWNPLGQQLTRQNGTATPDVLKWHDVDCTLGVAHVYMMDQLTGQKTSRPFITVAKFGNHPSQNSQLNLIAILGMNFLADNGLNLNLDGTGNNMTGKLTFQ